MSPREQVAPDELKVLRRNGRDVTVPTDDKSKPTTGRRTAYARQLIDGTHPLTARVFVNRVWLHHMGRGIVATPSDFGISGEKPTHPQLLDWLANDFMQHGWDQKRLHRMILLSRTYQQVSTRTPKLDDVDPENALYARMSLRRLEAEAIRDAILSVAGNLNDEIGGASIPVTEDPEGKVVIGQRKIRDGLKAEVLGGNADAARRSAYIEVQRALPLNVLATFDQPTMNPNCDLRNSSTVATQSLWFLNDSMMVDRSTELASSMLEMRNPRDAVQHLFLRLFAAEANTTELDACLQFLDKQQQHFAAQDASKSVAETKLAAMAALCQTMMASNRFLYVD